MSAPAITSRASEAMDRLISNLLFDRDDTASSIAMHEQGLENAKARLVELDAAVEELRRVRDLVR